MQPAVALHPLTGPAPPGGIPVTSLRLQRSVDWPAGQVEARCSGSVKLPAPGTVMSMTATAGADSPPAVIFTGRLLRRESGPWGGYLLIEEATGPLTRLRVDATYESSTASAVIQDLAGRAKVTASVTGSGAQLPFYAVLSVRSAMDYLVELGLLSGFRLASTVEGTLTAVPAISPGPLTGTVLGPGSGPVLGLIATDCDDKPATAVVVGDGSFATLGPGTQSWVLKDPSALKAGAGPGLLLLPGLKTPADVQMAEKGHSQRLAEASRPRRLSLMGPPPADLGAVITLTGFPSGDGPARVAAIHVLWHVQTGLQTQLTLFGLT
jgi:hypothetical protein